MHALMDCEKFKLIIIKSMQWTMDFTIKWISESNKGGIQTRIYARLKIEQTVTAKLKTLQYVMFTFELKFDCDNSTKPHHPKNAGNSLNQITFDFAKNDRSLRLNLSS